MLRSFHIVAAKKGFNVVYQGYQFKINKKTEKKIYYKCASSSCDSRLATDIDQLEILILPVAHNHDPPDDDVEAKSFREKLLGAVEVSPDKSAKHIYTEAVRSFDGSRVPEFSSIRSSMMRHRAKRFSLSHPCVEREDPASPENWKHALHDRMVVLNELESEAEQQRQNPKAEEEEEEQFNRDSAFVSTPGSIKRKLADTSDHLSQSQSRGGEQPMQTLANSYSHLERSAKKVKSDEEETCVAGAKSEQPPTMTNGNGGPCTPPSSDSAAAVPTKPVMADTVEKLKKLLEYEDANLLLLKKLRGSQQRPVQQQAPVEVPATQPVANATPQPQPPANTANRQPVVNGNSNHLQQAQQQLLQLQQSNQLKAQQAAILANQRQRTNVPNPPMPPVTPSVVSSTRPNITVLPHKPPGAMPPNVVPTALFRGPPPVTSSANNAAVNNANARPLVRPPDPVAAAKREQAAKLALKKQLEKTLLQIPPPRPPPSNLDFLPWPTIEFLYLIGLEETVERVLTDTNVKPEPRHELLEPYQCHQCQSDFTTVWKKDQEAGAGNGANANATGGKVICEQCLVNNNKKAVKKEHTNRLKLAVENALQQEKEIIQKLKEEERKNAAAAAASRSQAAANHTQSPIAPQAQPLQVQAQAQFQSKPFINPSPATAHFPSTISMPTPPVAPTPAPRSRILNPAPLSRNSMGHGLPPGMRTK